MYIIATQIPSKHKRIAGSICYGRFLQLLGELKVTGLMQAVVTLVCKEAISV